MPPIVQSGAVAHQPVITDTGRPRMAKANVGIPDITRNQAWIARVGGAFGRARAKVGWSIDRTAREMDLDAREVGKWENGARRVQIDRVMAVAELREPFATELALLVDGVEVVTEIRFRRMA